MDEDTKVGDDTSIEETADDSASTDEGDAPAEQEGDAAETAEKPSKDKELADNYKRRAEKAERELKELKGASKDKPQEKQAKQSSEDIDKRVQAALDKRDLDAMEYSDDIKKAIKRVAAINETSVKAAESDPYVQTLIEKWKKDKEATEAALSRNNKTGGKAKFDPDHPPQFDFTTEKGRKEYDEWTEALIKHETATRGR